MARWFEELVEASAPEPARRPMVMPLAVIGPVDNGQVQLTEVVKGLGGEYVDALPLPPGKMIRLEQLSTGRNYQPRAIELDVSMADGATNLTDLEIRFSLHGKSYGRSIRASEFIIDGTPHRVPFPPCRGETLTVGSLERLTVDVHHRGQGHSVNSIRAAVYYVDDNVVPLRSSQSQPDSSIGATQKPPPAPEEDTAAKFRELEQRHARLRSRFNELAAIVSELSGAG